MTDLDISATKQIILATYQMSSEGLNIPTLNTLILASPIGDIQQSVGRILREKKEDRKYIPLTIDIFDDFSVVKNKGFKRLKYYKSNGYIIKNFIENMPVVKCNNEDKPIMFYEGYEKPDNQIEGEPGFLSKLFF